MSAENIDKMSAQKKSVISNIHLVPEHKSDAAQGKSSNTPNEEALSSSFLSNNEPTNGLKRSLVDKSLYNDICKKIRLDENIDNSIIEYEIQMIEKIIEMIVLGRNKNIINNNGDNHSNDNSSDSNSDVSDYDEPYDEELVNHVINIIKNFNKKKFLRFIKLFGTSIKLFDQFENFITQYIGDINEKGDLGNILYKMQLLKNREELWREKYKEISRRLKELQAKHEIYESEEVTVNQFPKPYIFKRPEGLPAFETQGTQGPNQVQLKNAAAQESVDIINIDDDDDVALIDTDINESTSKTTETTTKKSTITSSSPVILKPSNVIHKKVGPPSSALDIANTDTKCNIHLTGSDDLIDVTNGLNIEHPPNNIVNYSPINTQISTGTSSQQLQEDLTIQVDLSSVTFIEPSKLPQTASYYMEPNHVQLPHAATQESEDIITISDDDAVVFKDTDIKKSTSKPSTSKIIETQPKDVVPSEPSTSKKTIEITSKKVIKSTPSTSKTIQTSPKTALISKPSTTKTIGTTPKKVLSTTKATTKTIETISKKVIGSTPSTSKTTETIPKKVLNSRKSTSKTTDITPKKEQYYVQLPNVAELKSVDFIIIIDNSDFIFENTDINESTSKMTVSKPSTSKIEETIPKRVLCSNLSTSKTTETIPKKVLNSKLSVKKNIKIAPKKELYSKPTTSTSIEIIPKKPAHLPTNPNKRSLPKWKKLPPAPKLSLYIPTDNSKVLILSWNMNLSSLIADISLYEIYVYHEDPTKVLKQVSWKKIGESKALPLPMGCSLNELLSGEDYYFAVRAVDIHGRVGPFSEIQRIYNP